mgnify:CR=1 FL=1
MFCENLSKNVNNYFVYSLKINNFSRQYVRNALPAAPYPDF